MAVPKRKTSKAKRDKRRGRGRRKKEDKAPRAEKTQAKSKKPIEPKRKKPVDEEQLDVEAPVISSCFGDHMPAFMMRDVA